MKIDPPEKHWKQVVSKLGSVKLVFKKLGSTFKIK